MQAIEESAHPPAALCWQELLQRFAREVAITRIVHILPRRADDPQIFSDKLVGM